MTKLYCYDHKSDNVESDSDDETHIDIKDNAVVVERDSKAAVQKTKKWKIPIVYNILKRRNMVLKKRNEKRQFRWEWQLRHSKLWTQI